MSARSGHRSGIIGQLTLTAHQFVKALPEGSDRLVFPRHSQHFFQLAIQDVTRGQQFLEPLGSIMIHVSRFLDGLTLSAYCGDLCGEPVALSLEERGLPL